MNVQLHALATLSQRNKHNNHQVQRQVNCKIVLVHAGDEDKNSIFLFENPFWFSDQIFYSQKF
jgi:hypothetical protein